MVLKSILKKKSNKSINKLKVTFGQNKVHNLTCKDIINYNNNNDDENRLEEHICSVWDIIDNLTIQWNKNSDDLTAKHISAQKAKQKKLLLLSKAKKTIPHWWLNDSNDFAVVSGFLPKWNENTGSLWEDPPNVCSNIDELIIMENKQKEIMNHKNKLYKENRRSLKRSATTIEARKKYIKRSKNY